MCPTDYPCASCALQRLSAPERIMTVCEVCGVFINTIDTLTSQRGGKIPQPILVGGFHVLGWGWLRLLGLVQG